MNDNRVSNECDSVVGIDDEGVDCSMALASEVSMNRLADLGSSTNSSDAESWLPPIQLLDAPQGGVASSTAKVESWLAPLRGVSPDEQSEDLAQNVQNTLSALGNGSLDARLLQQHVNMARSLSGEHDGPAAMAILINKAAKSLGIDVSAQYSEATGTFVLRSGTEKIVDRRD
ncbi:MAG: hypothetical protein K2W95_05825 [Candidatus Obscuribacterales bacterium]|nr:hypothetical protein [Candidatus Obscuribacterales bacterium]